uniref:Kisspeptin 1 prepropeptide n=1 Tax=Thalassoma bifasciatum TaxID=76338 RepID=A0A2Z1UVQ5_THABI|nr:kisspeptin 1 prepropeptide [Thalassoma bifasciatum]
MMNRLMVAVMMAALCADVYSSITVTSTYTSERDFLNALRDARRLFPSTAAKHSGSCPVDGERTFEGAWSGRGRRIFDLLHLKTVGKRQDVTSYNLNSFGLRYGKRDRT